MPFNLSSIFSCRCGGAGPCCRGEEKARSNSVGEDHTVGLEGESTTSTTSIDLGTTSEKKNTFSVGNWFKFSTIGSVVADTTFAALERYAPEIMQTIKDAFMKNLGAQITFAALPLVGPLLIGAIKEGFRVCCCKNSNAGLLEADKAKLEKEARINWAPALVAAVGPDVAMNIFTILGKEEVAAAIGAITMPLLGPIGRVAVGLVLGYLANQIVESCSRPSLGYEKLV